MIVIFIFLMASDTEHVFLCTYWSSVCLLWSNVYLPIFNWVIYLFWMFHFIASYSCFMDQISSLLSLKDCLAIWNFLLPPALSVFPLSSLFLFVCLVCSLLHYRFFMNIWIFSHIKKNEWGTEVLTGSCVKSRSNREITPYCQSLRVFSFGLLNFPQRNPPTFSVGTLSQVVRVLRSTERGRDHMPLVGPSLCRLKISVSPIC